MNDNRVSLEISEGIADVRLNRPEKLNALDTEMFLAIVEAGESLKSESGLRAVVLSGEGDSFSAGADFAAMDMEVLMAVADGGITHVAQQASWVWQELDVPVIAAIRGNALGGGFQIALGPDIRIVHPDARLALLEVQYGVVPDMAASVTLARLVGSEVMKELYFTGRVVSGREAVDLGIALRTAEDPHDDAMRLAGEIASKNPDAIKRIKTLVKDATLRTPAQNLALEREYIDDLIGSPNQREAVRAIRQKRAPEFSAED